MAKITLEVSDEEFAVMQKDQDYFDQLILRAVAESIAGRRQERSEWVKAMTRLKTPVVNWDDLELQILKGSVGGP